MKADGFGRRGVALEDEFFRKVDKNLQQDLRERWQQGHEVEALKQESLIDDDSVIEELLAAGVHPEMFRAMSLLPAVFVAWSNGYVDPKESDAILQAASAGGINPESATGQLLHSWLDHKPSAKLFDAWCDYVTELQKVLDPAAYRQLHQSAIASATKLAQAAGGFLGLQSISSNEHAAIQKVNEAFALPTND